MTGHPLTFFSPPPRPRNFFDFLSRLILTFHPPHRGVLLLSSSRLSLDRAKFSAAFLLAYFSPSFSPLVRLFLSPFKASINVFTPDLRGMQKRANKPPTAIDVRGRSRNRKTKGTLCPADETETSPLSPSSSVAFFFLSVGYNEARGEVAVGELVC